MRYFGPKSDHSPGNDSGFQTDHCVNCILGPHRLSNSWSHWWATVDNILEIILKWKTEQWKKNMFLVTSSTLTRQSHDFFAANSRMSQWLRVMSATFKQHLKSLMGNCTQHLGDHLPVLREYLLGQKQRCGLLTGDSSECFWSLFWDEPVAEGDVGNAGDNEDRNNELTLMTRWR